MRIILRKFMIGLALSTVSVAPSFADEVWIARRNLIPGDVIRADDVDAQTPNRLMPDALPVTRDVTGMEVKRRVYAGHPIGGRDVGALTAVKANAPVEVLWKTGTLTLTMQGKALEPGAVGDEIRVLNTATSRAVRGTIISDNTVEVRTAP